MKLNKSTRLFFKFQEKSFKSSDQDLITLNENQKKEISPLSWLIFDFTISLISFLSLNILKYI